MPSQVVQPADGWQATEAFETQGVDAARDLMRHANERVTRRHYIEDDGRRILDPRWLFPGAN